MLSSIIEIHMLVVNLSPSNLNKVDCLSNMPGYKIAEQKILRVHIFSFNLTPCLSVNTWGDWDCKIQPLKFGLPTPTELWLRRPVLLQYTNRVLFNAGISFVT